jgi:hypothetical protein
MGFEVVPNSPYSQDLASSDLRMSAALKKTLKGIYSRRDEVQAATAKWF